MKGKKSLFALGVAGAMIVALTGCSSGTSADTPSGTSADTSSGSSAGSSSGTSGGTSGGTDEHVDLTMTIWGSDVDKKVYTERLALAQKALPNITVKLVQISDNYDTKLQTMIAGGQSPDVIMTAEAVNVLSSKGQLEDLGPALQKRGIDPVATFGEGSVKTYSTSGHLWGVPDRAGAMVLYYNKDLFDKAGVAYPDGTWDWQQFRDAAKKLTVSANGKTTTWGYAAGDWWPWYMTWMYQNGGRILDDNGKPVVNSPENVEALTFYNDMVLKDHSAPSPQDYADAGLKNGQPDPLFAQGKLAMETTGFWNIASLSDATFKWGVAPLWHGKDKAVPAFGSALAVSSQSKHKEAAEDLVAFLTSDEGETPIATSGLDIPSNLKLLKSDTFLKAPWNKGGIDLGAFTDSAESIYSPPLVPEWNQIQKAFTDGMDATWKGQASVADGLSKVQSTLEGIFK